MRVACLSPSCSRIHISPAVLLTRLDGHLLVLPSSTRRARAVRGVRNLDRVAIPPDWPPGHPPTNKRSTVRPGTPTNGSLFLRTPCVLRWAREDGAIADTKRYAVEVRRESTFG